MKNPFALFLFIAVSSVLPRPASAFDPPCKTASGISVSIPGFQDSVYTNRTDGWTRNQCREIAMRESLGFSVAVSNLTGRTVSGTLSVCLNDDWSVNGFAGDVEFAPFETKLFGYTAVPGRRAVSAHYPIHARFKPKDAVDAIHAIAIFRTVDPAWTPRPKAPPDPVRPGISCQLWKKKESEAIAMARKAFGGDLSAKGSFLISDGPSARYGVGVAKGDRDLADGAIAFFDGTRLLVYRGFEVMIDNKDALSEAAEIPVFTEISVVGGALRIRWTMPGVKRSRSGNPRFTRLNLSDCSQRIRRGYMGLGHVLESPGTFRCSASGFSHCTRHVGADYENGLSLVHATDTIQQSPFLSVRERNVFSTLTGNDATFFLVPGSNGAFEAARRFRRVAGYRKSPGHDLITSRVCLDRWFDTNYDGIAANVRKLSRHGVTDCIYVKHDWRRWGWDYADPDNDPLIPGVGSHAESVRACQEAGMLYVPHDNYTDVYPYSDNYTYRDVVFDTDGFVRKAFYNPERNILAYRWLPMAPQACARRNMAIIRNSYAPDGIFLDVYTAHCPYDYMDRGGVFHSRQEMSQDWGRIHRMCLEELGRPRGPAISEAGQDHLVGVLDAGQSDHYAADYFIRTPGAFADSERVPWHDMVTHGYYVLFAGGLQFRYAQTSPREKKRNLRLHGYGSDDYLSNTLIGGRNPMAEGKFCEATVRTYWMLHDVCASLAKAELLSHEFGPTIHQQHTVFSNGAKVWTNRATGETWTVSGNILPGYGFWAEAPGGLCTGSILSGGRHIAFSRSPEKFFLDVRDGRGPAEFWAVKTSRAALLEFPEGAGEMKITPPRTYKTPYTVWIDLAKLGRGNSGVKEVRAQDAHVAVDWSLAGGKLRVVVPAQTECCTVVWSDPAAGR